MENEEQYFTNRIVEIIAELTEVQPDDIELSSPLDEQGVDSLMALELAVLLEREFNVYLSEEDLVGIETIDDILVYYWESE